MQANVSKIAFSGKSTPDIQIIKYPGGLVLPPILPSAHLPHPEGVAAFPG
ncbi:MAG: hypothetical protein WB615_01340 [Candidatus Tumulicola sp.]